MLLLEETKRQEGRALFDESSLSKKFTVNSACVWSVMERHK